MRSLVLVFCALLALTSVAHAQTHPSEGHTLSEQAKSAFDRGDFVEAARLLEEAYRVKPWPVLLYNLARAYQQAGNKARAVDAYERYLAAEPTATDAGAVRESIRQLNEQIARDRELEQQATAAKESATAEADAKRRALEDAERARRAADEATERERHKPSALPWVTTAIGVGGIAVGFVFGGLANSAHASAVSDASVSTAQSDQASAQSFALAANVLFVAGGTITLIGVIWGVVDLRLSLSRRVHAAFSPMGFSLRGEF